MKLVLILPLFLLGFYSLTPELINNVQEVTAETKFKGTVEGSAILAPRNTPVRSGRGLYGRPAPANSSAPGSSTDSILVVLTGNTPASGYSTQLKQLNQKNQQFVPGVLPVRIDQKVRITNSDPVYHNVFSLTSPNKFNVGRRPNGDNFDVSFEKPGVVDVFCDIHSNMHAIIYVLPPEAISWVKIKSGETFSFDNIPDGEYELQIYALGYQQASVNMLVKNGETTQAGTITLNP